MRQKELNDLIPLLTTPAGSCLTWENWQQAGVNTVAYGLDELLMKPGYAVLKELKSIRAYSKWPGKIVINAILPPPNRDGIYSIKSHYEGGTIRINVQALFELICILQPDVVILPVGTLRHYDQFWQHLPKNIEPFFALSDELLNSAGNYLIYKQEMDFQVFIAQISNSSKKIYIKGDFNQAQLSQLLTFKQHYIESNSPAQDGMHGIVYGACREFNILAADMVNQHALLDNHCACPVCTQKLTRAYFHHLLQQTPLLAQRFLIQHNFYYSQHYLVSEQ